MKKNFVLLFLMIISSLIFCQELTVKNEVSIGNSSDNYLQEAIKLSNEEYALFGFTEDRNSASLFIVFVDNEFEIIDSISINLGVPSPEFYNYPVKKIEDGFILGFNHKLIKLNSTGEIIWERNLDDQITTIEDLHVAVDGYYLVGEIHKSTYNGIILKVDLNANTVWRKEIEDSRYVYLNSIEQTTNSNLLITGFIWGISESDQAIIILCSEQGNIINNNFLDTEIYGLPSERSLTKSKFDNNFYLGSIGGINGILLKLDPNGNLIWRKSYDPPPNTKLVINSIHELENNNLMLLGTARYTIGISIITSDFHIINTDSNGNRLYSQSLKSSSDMCISNSLNIDANCEIELFGSSYYNNTGMDFSIICLEYPLSNTIEYLSAEIFIYPNPVESEITFKDSNSTSKEIKIFNLLGQLVYFNKDIYTELNLPELNKGSYIMHVTEQSNQTKSTIFIKN